MKLEIKLGKLIRSHGSFGEKVGNTGTGYRTLVRFFLVYNVYAKNVN